jgi:hypothetical protein
VEGIERGLVVLLPRGREKTTLLAAVALHHLLTVPNAAVYAAASSREQARILYESAAHLDNLAGVLLSRQPAAVGLAVSRATSSAEQVGRP